MNYTQITDAQRQRMLSAVGVRSLDELIDARVPRELQLGRELDIAPGLSEQGVRAAAGALAGENAGKGLACFAGAGAYDHYIPAAVDALAAQGAVTTAYTPYQAEASQGSLQAFFEFQTLICRLTGMDVANASMYEAATSLAEAVLMCADDSGKRQVVSAGAVHPHYVQTVRTYLEDLPLSMVELAPADGLVDRAAVGEAVTADTAAVIVQSPNLFGLIETGLGEIIAAAHEAGAAVIHVFDPISLGVLKGPGAWGADVAVGEGQPLGVPLSFGGPYLGLFACRGKYVRKIPGRLIGQTVDAEERRAYCLTLQTREQHIRRAKATSNICTNQGLMAYRAAAYLAVMGPRGLARAARASMAKAHDLARRIAALPGCDLPFAHRPMFREFVVRCSGATPAEIIAAGVERGLLAGVDLGRLDPSMADCLLVACTEQRTDDEMGRLVDLLGEVCR